MLVMHLFEEIGAHRTVFVAPVAKADTIVVWVSSEVNDNSHQNEANERDDFDTAEPELEFSEDTDTEHIDDEDCEGEVEYV